MSEVLADKQSEHKRTGARRHKPACGCGFCERIRWVLKRSAEKKALPRPRHWNAKKEAFVQHFTDIDGDGFNNASRAAELAGYTASRGRQMIHEPRTRRAIIEAMERAGITSDFLSARVKEGLLAEEIRYFTFEGRVVDERRDPDHYARHKWAETAMRARGDFPREEPVAQAALILRVPDAPLSVEEWNARLDDETSAANALGTKAQSDE